MSISKRSASRENKKAAIEIITQRIRIEFMLSKAIEMSKKRSGGSQWERAQPQDAAHTVLSN
jgi:hypothetical protein